MYQFQASQGWLKLKNTVHRQFSPEHPFTALVPDLSGLWLPLTSASRFPKQP